MSTQDLVERALDSAIDWTTFEKLAFEILTNDDLPRLRRLGGRADQGADAVQEAFYQDQSHLEVVVQVTSERGQVAKLRKTLKRLQDERLTFSTLVIVYQQAVSSSTRRNLQAEARTAGVTLDVRDQAYLVARLAKDESSIFARYFGSPREQLDKLLNSRDPLRVATTREKKALLATLGAFVISPHAALARRTLFQKTVLAIIAAQPGPSSITTIRQNMASMLPEEDVSTERVEASVAALEKSAEVVRRGDTFEASADVLASAALVTQTASSAYNNLLQAVIAGCKRMHRLDQATEGFIERNLRRALLDLFRTFGPLAADDGPKVIDEELEPSLFAQLSKQVPSAVAKTCLAALASHVEDASHWRELAPFGRAYCALALWNMDPVGRRWQKEAMARSLLALDTDAVLHLIIEELPQSAPLRKAVSAMAAAGVEVVVSDQVVKETIDSLARSDTTYNKFENSLLRMSPAMVSGNVWHALVQGFYYAKQKGFSGDWQTYKAQYFVERDARQYLLFQLARIAPITERILAELPEGWQDDLLSLTEQLLKQKEGSRLKASFRTPEQMADRVRYDIEMALYLAVEEQGALGPRPRGFLVSEDRAFSILQKMQLWGARKKIHVFTHAMPELAEFACGIALADQDAVRMLFDPILGASAYLMAAEIVSLTSAGVELRDVHLARLEYDLKNGLEARILGAEMETGGEEIEAAFDLVSDAHDRGYRLDPRLERWIARAEELEKSAAEEARRRRALEAKLVEVALTAAGESKKGRTRARAALAELGIEPPIVTRGSG